MRGVRRLQQFPGQVSGEPTLGPARAEPALLLGLVDGVRAHQARIDTLISDAAENWRIDRMAAIDRNILRLGAFEMLYDPEVPTKVAINEALELAKRYSTAQSSRAASSGLWPPLGTSDPPTKAISARA